MTRTVLITGATGGIGGALVRAAADRGWAVLAAARDGSALQALCDAVPGMTPLPASDGSPARHDPAPGTTPLVVDLRAPSRFAESLPRLGRLDAVIHCAGIAEVAPVAESSYPLWHDTLTVNVAAAAEITRLYLPALRAAAGHVVFVNATPGLHAVPRWSAYTASKAALREVADALRQEEAPHGVRVTSVFPGGTATGLLREVRSAFGRPFDPADCIQPETLADLILNVLDMRNDAYIPELSVLPTPRP
ncbi:SDR family NAD(P)-dependent oxidoreductase [Actinoplanes sp. NBRC 101535]|uniref:SDR family NAD(P)-dependent oxidoreductase n=1 Tax=Actinoplanes sp. NBRC 101535 TaxID=3032196 RepID=UPI0024A2B9AF|nr:SDR family NAD(P)-dependent oxidoreductase [Actinoplanes sp. NBRC 101535]GLY06658.1 short chain dehydrogenase [Actinoplanes sp. NBRC 101535]